jgi:acyl dehydratase
MSGEPEFEVGQVVAEREVHLTRADLARYAEASGDFNPIHLRDDIAESVGLPSVIAHGMLTMGLAVQPVIDAIGGDPGRVRDYQVRFTRPVPVHATAGADVRIVATVAVVDEAGARIDLTVSLDGATVLGKAQVRVAARP